jgi:hypothetical protein
MGDASAFVIKGEEPREMRVSFTWIIGDMQWERASPFCHRSRHVLDINLTEMRQKLAHLVFILHRASSAPR